MDDRLDNPIRHALTTEQTGFAERDGDAARAAGRPGPLVLGIRVAGVLAAMAGQPMRPFLIEPARPPSPRRQRPCSAAPAAPDRTCDFPRCTKPT